MRPFLSSFAVLTIALSSTTALAQTDTEDKRNIPTDPTAKAMYDTLQSPQGMRHGYDLQKFYQARGYEPLWLEDDGDWERKPDAFVEAIAEADEEGLKPEDYPLASWLAQKPELDNATAIARYDAAISDVVFAYIDDLHNGKVDPQDVFPNFFIPDEEQEELAWVAQQVLSAGDVEKALQQQTPQIEEYARLRKALQDYRAIAAKGGWEPIKKGGVIKPGQVDERIPAIRERLRLLGRLDSTEGLSWFDAMQARFGFGDGKNDKPEYDSVELSADEQAKAERNPEWVYTQDVEATIRQFQQRRGAKVDGVIGSETLTELNMPIEDRIDQIVLAMEQWRWLPKQLGSKYVFVNTAGYYAKGIENGRTVVNTPVIVGQVAHQTPSFSSYITDVKFYPDWTVPHSIAKRYLLDKIRKNPAVVQSLGYELYNEAGEEVPLHAGTISQLQDAHFPPYRFRQKPGPDNALGLVRFSVENDYSIYLHDTPSDSLFEETDRNFSSGCIRVGEPVKMAQFLLAGNSSLSERGIAEKFNVETSDNLETEVVDLQHKVPVHIMYMTAWVDEGGNIRFESDAYSRDGKLKAAMGL